MFLAIVSFQTPPILPLESFLSQVELRFPKLIGAEAERLAVTAKRQTKQGAFDPQVTLGTESLRYNSASTRGKASAGVSNELGIEVATPQGLKLATGRSWNAGGVKSPDSATGSDGSYFLYAKLPLARGGGINEKLVGLAQARPAFRQIIIDLLIARLVGLLLCLWLINCILRRSSDRRMLGLIRRAGRC